MRGARVLGAVFVAAAIGLAGTITWLWNTPGERYFEATVRMPDFIQGENPVVDYRRTIHRTQQMWWHVEIRPVPKRPIEFCKGAGSNLYSRSESKELPLPLTDYAGVEECNLPPGRYRLHTCWQFFVGPFSKRTCVDSNAFTVRPKP